MGARTLAIVIVLLYGLSMREVIAGSVTPQQQIWHLVDKCKKDAFTKFPDQTKEGLEQRQKYEKQCQFASFGAQAPSIRN
jgi:hypothetical protein